jgi:hypothetical protein
MSKIEVNTIDVACGSTITLGSSGKTVAIACGASTTGMGRSGTVDWCTTVYTNSPGTITSVSGKGYFINTTSGTVTINLPTSPSAGDIVSVKDYARTFNSNAVTVGRGGSKMCGACADTTLNEAGSSTTLIYVDSTKGWMFINDDATKQAGAAFVTATGGTVTESGDYKIHTFTSDANFIVSCAGNSAGSNKVSYMVVAGGGGGAGNPGASDGSSGGGAGGYREGKAPAFDSYTASPLVAPDGITVPAATYPITVGGGGTAGPASLYGGKGNNSVFSTIISAGGGGGQYPAPPYSPGNMNGGSGAGAAASGSACANQVGTGNTPPVSPPQGNNGGNYQSSGASAAGGGGGAGAVGSNAPSNTVAGDGGAGVTSEITASPVQRAGGGGGSSYPVGTGGSGGAGGGGDGGRAPGTPSPAGQSGTANTGGGGGAANANPGNPNPGGAGGSGIVVIRYKFQ